MKYFSVSYRLPGTTSTATHMRSAESREALIPTLPANHPHYAGYVLYAVDGIVDDLAQFLGRPRNATDFVAVA